MSPRPAWGSGGRRPPWWPEGEPGPFAGGPNWQGNGRRIARRIGCFLGVVLLILTSAIFGVVWLLLSAFGAVNSAPFDTAVAVTALVLGALAIAVAILVLRRLAAPVGALIEGAHRLEGGDLSTRVPVRGPSDLRALARAMNAMSSRLEAEETRRRSVLADIAHELRTPLSIIRGQAEAITDGIYPADAEHMAPIVSATESLEMLVNDLSTLTLAESGALHLHLEPIDVAVLVNETLDAFGAEARAAGVHLTEHVDEHLPPLNADPGRMRGVLGNLVSNALAHARSGGHDPSRRRRLRCVDPAHGARRRHRHPGGPAAASVRSLCERPVVDWIGARARNRSRCRGGARRLGERHEHVRPTAPRSP